MCLLKYVFNCEQHFSFFTFRSGYPTSGIARVYCTTSVPMQYSDWLRSLSPGWGKSFLHVVQTGSGAHPASYPGGKAAGA
jgi:hypothetical protein